MAKPARSVSTWSPLRVGVFRALWIAVLVANVGTWMQTVGAQWLLVHLPHAAILVALVQTRRSPRQEAFRVVEADAGLGARGFQVLDSPMWPP